ncbi:glycosyl hydrolase, partial [Planctomycetota bacterium]
LGGFIDPPCTARPQAWWWWLRTETSWAAITRDLEEMKAKGLSGCMIMDNGVASFGPRKWKQKTIIDATEIHYEDTDEYQGGGASHRPRRGRRSGRNPGGRRCVSRPMKRIVLAWI